ncbi:hypothetical protein LJR255_002646 [Pararhizobium sp. LjRoot255]|uniref:hypothetical protein n=1 Tax=Pararhizobium sp. LjRoot255 TaxID=3342298 RepID=UPI003ECE8653
MDQSVLIHTDLDVGKAFQPYHADQVGSTTTLGDANLKAGSELSAPWFYAVLLAAQTAAAFILFWMVFPIFYSLVTHLGERQKLDYPQQLAIVASAALLHCFYWTRLKWVSVTPPFHSVLVAHLKETLGDREAVCGRQNTTTSARRHGCSFNAQASGRSPKGRRRHRNIGDGRLHTLWKSKPPAQQSMVRCSFAVLNCDL